MTARYDDENDKIPPDTIKIDNPLRIEDSMKKKSTLSRGGEGKTPSGNLPTLNAGRRLQSLTPHKGQFPIQGAQYADIRNHETRHRCDCETVAGLDGVRLTQADSKR